MRRVVTLFATAGVIAGMVVLRRSSAFDQRRDHAQLVRRLDQLHTDSHGVLEGIPALGIHGQWLIG